MSQPSPDAKAVVRALTALTTQVRRIADARQADFALTPDAADDAPTTPVYCPLCPRLVELGTPADATEHFRTRHPEQRLVDGPWPMLVPPDEQAPAADEDAPYLLRVLVDRAARGVLSLPGEGEALRRRTEQMINGRETWKAKGEEIERDRDRIAAELEKLRAVLEYEHKRANDAISREETAEQAAEEDRRRADIAETELRVLRAGLRANGADPTQIQNLWAQIRLRNRQWREARAAIERVRAVVVGRAQTTSAGISDHAIGQYDLAVEVLAALDGTEQPTTEQP